MLYIYRYSLLSKAFNTWKKITKSKDEALLASSSRGSYYTSSHIHPGVTGLRNLGNTCYINAALQSLGHLHFMRETFRQMGHDSMTNETSSSVLFDRQTTVECFQHISTKPNIIDESGRKRSLSRGTAISDGGGLAGGKGRLTNSIKNDNEDVTSLCEEIHRLMRVMWSGKWSVVTPHTVLTSIWRHIPSFRGYIQHDAQEFLW
jgi:ubiquitin carboxyl-terminal hydrolase 44/49